MKVIRVLIEIFLISTAYGIGWLVEWYHSPMSPALCLSGLPPDYQNYWEQIWQRVQLGGIFGLALLITIAFLLILLVIQNSRKKE